MSIDSFHTANSHLPDSPPDINSLLQPTGPEERSEDPEPSLTRVLYSLAQEVNAGLNKVSTSQVEITRWQIQYLPAPSEHESIKAAVKPLVDTLFKAVTTWQRIRPSLTSLLTQPQLESVIGEVVLSLLERCSDFSDVETEMLARVSHLKFSEPGSKKHFRVFRNNLLKIEEACGADLRQHLTRRVLTRIELGRTLRTWLFIHQPDLTRSWRKAERGRHLRATAANFQRRAWIDRSGPRHYNSAVGALLLHQLEQEMKWYSEWPKRLVNRTLKPEIAYHTGKLEEQGSQPGPAPQPTTKEVRNVFIHLQRLAREASTVV